MTIAIVISAVQAGTDVAPSSLSTLLSMVGSLLIVLAVAVGLAIVWRRLMPQNILGNTGLDVVATRHLGTRERLLLVKVGAPYLLLGSTPQSIQSLAEFREDELPDALKTSIKPPQPLWQAWRNKQ